MVFEWKTKEVPMKRLVRHARVLVTDGARAIILRNEGDAVAPDLKMVRSLKAKAPAAHELGADKPGRTNSSTGQISAMEITDLHRQAEDRFVAGIAAEMDRDLRAGDFEVLIVAAPPVALGEYRKAVTPAVAKVTVLEVDKDLTKHPTPEIAKLLLKALEDA
jgi:protein required for attachment to host cells